MPWKQYILKTRVHFHINVCRTTRPNASCSRDLLKKKLAHVDQRDADQPGGRPIESSGSSGLRADKIVDTGPLDPDSGQKSRIRVRVEMAISTRYTIHIQIVASREFQYRGSHVERCDVRRSWSIFALAVINKV